MDKPDHGQRPNTFTDSSSGNNSNNNARMNSSRPERVSVIRMVDEEDEESTPEVSLNNSQVIRKSTSSSIGGESGDSNEEAQTESTVDEDVEAVPLNSNRSEDNLAKTHQTTKMDKDSERGTRENSSSKREFTEIYFDFSKQASIPNLNSPTLKNDENFFSDNNNSSDQDEENNNNNNNESCKDEENECIGDDSSCRFSFNKHICTELCTTALHEAAKKGKADEIELILATNADPNVQDCQGRTALHYAVKGECNCDACIANATNCVRLLVECPRTDINFPDSKGETALHLAAENQSTKCAMQLLSSGADVSVKSKAGVKALKLIVEKIPEAMDCLLNRAISIEKYDAANAKCELKLDFGAIVGFDSKSNNSRMSRKHHNHSNSSNSSNGTSDSDGNPKLRRETQLLKQILDANSASRKRILTHPLIAVFLYLKWNRVRPLFWGTIMFHVILLMTYTLYILDVYIISCPYRPKITEPAAVKAAKAAGIEEGFLTQGNETIRAEYIKFSFFQFSPQLNMQEIQLGITECHLEIGPTVKSICLLILTFVVTMNEMLKLLPSPKAYLKSTYNLMLIAYFLFILLTSWPVFMESPNGISFWQYQAAAFGLFLAWSMMLFQLAKLPKLGLYVEILTKVMKNFGFFMLTYASLIIAFALAFCVLFPGNAPYSSIPLSILKVLMMMVGEVNYEDLFYGEEENPVDDLLYPITGHILYGAFVIMITIVLMNLLVGLTVSDIQKGLHYNHLQGLQKDAELTRLTRQIEEIAQLESFIFSKRIQLTLSGKIGSYLRDRILVIPPNKHFDKNASTKPLVENNCILRVRPNDPNDKVIPEHLKLEVLRIAAFRQRTSRTNQCKNFAHFRDPLAPSKQAPAPQTPIFDDHLPPPSWTTLTKPQRPTLMSGLLGSQTHLYGNNFMGPPGFSSSQQFRNLSPQGYGPPPQYEYFLKRLEDKIMDRMKIQMDSLYQRIEEKLMDAK